MLAANTWLLLERREPKSLTVPEQEPANRPFSKFSDIWWLNKQFQFWQTNEVHETEVSRAPSLSQVIGR